MVEESHAYKRQFMVETQLITRGIKDPSVIQAMKETPRHAFVPLEMLERVYDDGPLPIGDGQTISQPYIVALMTQEALISSSDIVLEIGTGSGYQAAVLSAIAKDVYSVERIESLSLKAQKSIKEIGIENIHFKVDDGSLGWPEQGPYDVILVTAGSPKFPKSLFSQLRVGGRLIIPIGDSILQRLVRYTKTGEDSFKEESIESVRFVPLIGEEGWYP
jgi:protein-L-isoaspartate(D-aspartate) O-methyltransferase